MQGVGIDAVQTVKGGNRPEAYSQGGTDPAPGHNYSTASCASEGA